MTPDVKRARDVLAELIGLHLAGATHAASLRSFRFGPGEPSDSDFFLHVQCPSRLEHSGAIVTGDFDWWEPLEESVTENWEPSKGGSLQDKLLQDVLWDSVSTDGSHPIKCLRVISVTVNELGDICIQLANVFRLAVFPRAPVKSLGDFFDAVWKNEHFVWKP